MSMSTIKQNERTHEEFGKSLLSPGVSKYLQSSPGVFRCVLVCPDIASRLQVSSGVSRCVQVCCQGTPVQNRKQSQSQFSPSVLPSHITEPQHTSHLNRPLSFTFKSHVIILQIMIM